MNSNTAKETKSDLAIYRPQIGMRFVMRGCEFEVCFTEFGMVRYATSKGGKPHQVTVERFKELQREEEIAVLNPERHGKDKVDGVPTLPNLSEDELAAALRRTRYAQGAMADLAHPNSKRNLAIWIPEFARTIQDPAPPAPSTVSDWVRKLVLHGRDALVAPERKRGNRFFRFSPEIELLVLEAVDAFLEQEQRDANDVLAFIVGRLAERNMLTKDGAKVDIPSTRTIRRILNRIDPYLLTRLKKGRLAAERMARAAGKSIISPRPLMLVQIDTHFLKVFAVDPRDGKILGKPYLCCAFDVRTRCVVGMYVSILPASTTTTLGALKDMLTRPGKGLPGGFATTIVPDNGVEFRNSGVENLLRKLKINFEPATARDPNGKANIESFFRTLSLFLIQKLPGTTFSDLEKRGDYPSEKKAYATIDQIEEYVRYWVENEYHQRPHSSTGRIPIRMWEEETAAAKPLSLSEEEVGVIARRTFLSKIRKGRVTVKKLTYYSHALKTLEATFQGQVRVLVDELNLSEVLIEHPFDEGTLIQGDSTNPEYTSGLSMWEHEQIKKEMAEMTKKDLHALGQYTWVLARYKLLMRIQEDSEVARSLVAKITRGKRGSTQIEAVEEEEVVEDASAVPFDQVPPEAEESGPVTQREIDTDQSEGAANTKDDQPPQNASSDPGMPDILFLE